MQSNPPYCDDLTRVQVDSVHLGDEDGGHSLVKSGAVHVYSGSDRDDEAGYTPVNVVVLLQTPESDGQSCSTIRERQSYDKDTCKNFLYSYV